MSRAILTLIDGLRPDALSVANCAHINGLLEKGAASMRATAVMPSETLPCHMSIFHSVPPARHGVTSNTWTPMARPLPGLVEVAHAAGLRSAFLFNWEQLRDLSRPGCLDFAFYCHNSSHPEGDQVIADEAARYISAEKPDFAFVYFGSVDIFGHKHGWMTDGYLEQLERTDVALGTVLAALSDDVTVLLCSDHGGHERMHGTDQPEDMTIPWIIAGPGVRRGHVIEQQVNLIDAAPTLARVMGINPHPEWEGQCVDEVFE